MWQLPTRRLIRGGWVHIGIWNATCIFEEMESWTTGSLNDNFNITPRVSFSGKQCHKTLFRTMIICFGQIKLYLCCTVQVTQLRFARILICVMSAERDQKKPMKLGPIGNDNYIQKSSQFADTVCSKRTNKRKKNQTSSHLYNGNNCWQGMNAQFTQSQPNSVARLIFVLCIIFLLLSSLVHFYVLLREFCEW